MNNIFDRSQLMVLLEELSQELSARGQKGQLFIVGGAAMSLAYDSSRATRDIDAIFAPAPEIRECARIIAATKGYEDDWLNDAAKGFMPGNDPEAKELFRSESLLVQVASPQYLFAMKLQSSRSDRDIADAVLLYNQLDLKNASQALDIAESFYGAPNLAPKHQYVAEEIAAQAKNLTSKENDVTEHWQETANRYADRQVDWQQIAKYAPEANEPEQTRNCQYEYDYPAQETQSGDHGIGL